MSQDTESCGIDRGNAVEVEEHGSLTSPERRIDAFAQRAGRE
jgi:hypothetical protein